MKRPGVRSWTLLSIALFGMAMTQPAFFWGNALQAVPASSVLAMGARGVRAGYVEWLANPLLALAWILALARLRLPSAATTWMALALMLVFVCRRTLSLPGAESGQPITAYGAGYWLWVASALLMIVANRDVLRDNPYIRNSKDLQ